MMKKILLFMAAVIVIAVGWYVIYTYPKHISKSLSGVEFRSGKPNEEITPVTIQVNGTLQRSIRGILTFQGTIKLDGNTQDNPDNNRQLTVHFNGPGGMGFMSYGYYTNGTPVAHGYGNIFINGNFGEFVILESKGGWTTTDGLTIAAPASTRSQAVSISNELMKGFLNGYPVNTDFGRGFSCWASGHINRRSLALCLHDYTLVHGKCSCRTWAEELSNGNPKSMGGGMVPCEGELMVLA